MKISTINNVRTYLDNSGTAWLNIEDVARGLGFTQTKNGIEYIRWKTVNNYLNDFGFFGASAENSQQVGKDNFIPENIFYRLAMKVKNKTAEKFQIKVTDEILPAIRKHGFYGIPMTVEAMLNNPDLAIQLLQAFKTEQEEKKRLAAIIFKSLN